jgi:hypothetical protein
MPSFISRCVTGEVNVEGGVQTRLIEHLVHAVTKSEETTRLQHVSKVVSPVYFQDVPSCRDFCDGERLQISAQGIQDI